MGWVRVMWVEGHVSWASCGLVYHGKQTTAKDRLASHVSHTECNESVLSPQNQRGNNCLPVPGG